MTTSKRILLFFFGLLAAALLLLAGYTGPCCTSRIRTASGPAICRNSPRGWVCKTWEGEILLTSMPGAIPEKFEFSVRDDKVAADLTAATGKRVVLTYAQHKGVPSQCFGETEYYITKVVVQP
jgi:hypothetical protein